MIRFYLILLIICSLLSCTESELRKKGVEIKKNLLYNKAFEYRELQKADSAFLYFTKAKEFFLQQNDSLGVGKCLVNMAIISTNKGDYYGGQEISIMALPYFDFNNIHHQVYLNSNYNNLGIACYKLKDYNNALRFYNSALNYTNDPANILISLNNKAKTYQELKNYNAALKIYSRILGQPNISQIEYSRTLTNISNTKWLQNRSYNPVPSYLRALRIRTVENDLSGLNSSYFHLSDYYTGVNHDLALSYAKKMYGITKKINSPDDKLVALQRLINLSPLRDTKRYFEIYQSLSDSVETARNLAKNQFALIRYEAEQSKSDILRLEKDNSKKQYQIALRELFLGGAFLLFTCAIIVSALWYKKRKQKIEAKAEKDIRESQLKTSKKVHDVVANGLYRVITEMENKADFDKERILDKIDRLYNKSRDISYEDTIIADHPFNQTIADLLSSFETIGLKVKVVGNNAGLWANVSSEIKYEIEHILQELMINMDKHSNATLVSIVFERLEDQINISYKDDGIGVPDDIQFKNGLTNTENRINNINGKFTFDIKVEKGLGIYVSFPIS